MTFRVAMVVAALAAPGCAPAGFPPSAPHPLLGRALPALQRRATLDGSPLDAASFAGRPVLVKFFAEYCRPCQESLPAAQRVHETHPQVAFLGIDEDDSAETAAALTRRFGLSFPVVVDTDNVLSGRFRVVSLPTTFVADAAGVVRWVGTDAQTEDDLRRAVEAVR